MISVKSLGDKSVCSASGIIEPFRLSTLNLLHIPHRTYIDESFLYKVNVLITLSIFDKVSVGLLSLLERRDKYPMLGPELSGICNILKQSYWFFLSSAILTIFAVELTYVVAFSPPASFAHFILKRYL